MRKFRRKTIQLQCVLSTAKVCVTLNPQEMQISAISVLNDCNETGGCIGRNAKCSMEPLFINYTHRQSGNLALSKISRPANFRC
uniref:Uncharacterized protein n=1 Tax=Rhipicephalus microplus TaxID=6941 RepID=A0A6G5A1Y8_RHIMP